MSECNSCDKYDYQTHSCPIFCDVIRNTLDDVRADEKAKTIEESIEQIKCFNPSTTEEAKGLQEAINIMSRLKGDKE